MIGFSSCERTHGKWDIKQESCFFKCHRRWCNSRIGSLNFMDTQGSTVERFSNSFALACLSSRKYARCAPPASTNSKWKALAEPWQPTFQLLCSAAVRIYNLSLGSCWVKKQLWADCYVAVIQWFACGSKCGQKILSCVIHALLWVFTPMFGQLSYAWCWWSCALLIVQWCHKLKSWWHRSWWFKNEGSKVSCNWGSLVIEVGFFSWVRWRPSVSSQGKGQALPQ